MTFVGANLLTGQPGALLAVGLSNQNWAGGPLPLPLDAIGMPGCALQTSLELILSSGVSGVGGASWDLALPANAQFLGVQVFAQMIAAEPAANTAGLVVSRPLAVTLGW